MVDEELLLNLYAAMTRCRAFEQAFFKFALQDGVRIGHPAMGQEAVAAGICCALAPQDRLLSTHRSRAHAVAKGCDLDRLALELYGRATGLCRGRAGEMEVAQYDVGFMGACQVVGGNLPMAAGLALAAQLDESKRATVAFIGDGGVNQGSFHEVLNLAAVWSLPLLLVCENNGYAESTPASYAVAGSTIAARAQAFGIPNFVVDGQDAVAVYECAQDALSHIRNGKGPVLLEARTYRYYGHYYGDRHDRYRSRIEVERFKARDPIAVLRSVILATNGARETTLDTMQSEFEAQAERAVQLARQGPRPSWNDLVEGVFTPVVSHA